MGGIKGERHSHAEENISFGVHEHLTSYVTSGKNYFSTSVLSFKKKKHLTILP
jgi:hypothetical protein